MKLLDADLQARGFARIRSAHQSETTEDYVELIADLIAAQGEARLTDLAQRFGVSSATASKIVRRLQAEGYIASKPYRALFLTRSGEALALRCKARHEIVRNFLLRLGVSAENAAHDAEGIEHHLSPETLALMEKFGGE